ncbi:MAG: hypothetical protein U9P14_03050 [Gemmatimonadota bacterium]|nr:hypothetical protein [Gemmatimonadota bacterium]
MNRSDTWLNKRLLLLLIPVWLILWAGSLCARPGVDAGLDTTSILIGDPVRLTLTASSDTGETVRFPDLAAESPGVFELLSSSEPEIVESDNGSRVERRRYELTTFEPGKHQVPRLVFVSVKQDGSVDTLYTRVKTIEVVSLLAGLDSAEVRPLKGLAPVARLWHRLALWTAGVLLLVVLPLLLALRWYLARRAARLLDQARPAEPSRPPHLTALDELGRIKSLGLIEKGEVKLFHELVSSAIRNYIAAHYKVEAIEMTSWEVLSALEDKLAGEEALFDNFRRFLEACDLVKFAKYEPQVVEINSNFNLAYDLVENSRKLSLEKQAAAAAARETAGSAGPAPGGGSPEPPSAAQDVRESAPAAAWEAPDIREEEAR